MQKPRDKIRHLSSTGVLRRNVDEAPPGAAASMVERIIERHPYLRMARDAGPGDLGRSGEFAQAALKVFKDRLEAAPQPAPSPTSKRKKS
jgi:hypothetical protein